MAGELARLAADPWADIIVAGTITGSLNGEIKTWRFASAAGVFTEADEDPANASFQDVMLQGWRTERRVSEPQTLIGGNSTYNRGEILIENGDGRFTEWLDVDWGQSTADLRFGSRKTLDGFRFPYSEFVPALTGVVESVTAKSGAVLLLKLAGIAAELDEPLVESIYHGFGGALFVPVKTGSASATAVNDPSFDLSGAATLEWFGIIHEINTSQTTLFQKGAATDVSYRLGISAIGELRVQVAGSSNFVDCTGFTPTLDVYQYLGATISAAGKVTFYAALEGEEVTEVGSGTLAGGAGPAPVTGNFYVGFFTTTSTQKADVEPWEIRVWSGVRSIEDLRAAANGPIPAPKSQSGLVTCYKFPDGTGSTATSEIDSAQDLTLTNCTWASAYDGDDPEQFEGSTMGQTKGRNYGRPRNVSLANTDSQHHHHQWDDDRTDDILRLWEDRVPLFPDETISGGAGDFVVLASAKTITLSPSLSAHRFVPGQSDPARDGMRFEMVGFIGANNTGTKTVAANGISADGLTITVVEALTDETNGGAASLRTLAADRHYTYDLSRSVATLASSPAGRLTADVVARLGVGGKLRASELFEAACGEVPDITDLEIDPVVSFNSAPGATPPTRRDVMNGAARSAAAAWWEKRGGGYKMATWRLPSGDPVERFPDSDIDGVEPRETQIPYWKLTTGWAPNWTEQDAGSFPGSVAQGDRDFASNAYRYIPRILIPAASRPRLSTPRDPILTWCEAGVSLAGDRSEVEQIIGVAQALYTGQRRWWEIGLTGVAPLTLDLWDLIFVTYTEPGSGLESGRLVRIVGMIEETGSDLVLVEAFA